MLGGGAGRQWPAPWARGAGAGAGAGAGPSHFVTRSASKALMPWAALSRASSLAGGPCQKTASRCTPRCTHTGGCHELSPLPSPPCSSLARAPGPRAAASTGRRRGGLLAGTGDWHTRPRLCYQAATVAPSEGHTPGPYPRSRGQLAPSRSGGPDSDHWAQNF